MPGKVLAVRPDREEVDLEINAVFEIGMPKVEVITLQLPDPPTLNALRVGQQVLLRFRPAGGLFGVEWLGVLPPAPLAVASTSASPASTSARP